MTGRTGPCCVAVVDAGVRRVVVAAGDPFPQVAGRGFAYLRARGLAVTTGVGRREARRQNAPFFRAVELGRPWVHLKVAMSLDGGVAARAGERTTLSGPEATRWTQRLRGSVDAIAVGARHRPRRRPRVDGSRRLPASSPRPRRVRSASPALARGATGADDGCRPCGRVDRAGGRRVAGGVRVAGPRRRGGATDGTVPGALGVLVRRDVHSLLVEGGPTLHAACWQAGVVDRVSQLVSDRVLGPDAVRWDVPAWLNGWAPRAVPLGHDVLLEADVYGTD